MNLQIYDFPIAAIIYTIRHNYRVHITEAYKVPWYARFYVFTTCIICLYFFERVSVLFCHFFLFIKKKIDNSITGIGNKYFQRHHKYSQLENRGEVHYHIFNTMLQQGFLVCREQHVNKSSLPIASSFPVS